jgi:hypothetical protein
MGCSPSQECSARRPQKGQHQSFRQKVRHHGGSRCAQGITDSDFLLTVSCARRQQRRDIGTSDQQHQRNRREQNPERTERAAPIVCSFRGTSATLKSASDFGNRTADFKFAMLCSTGMNRYTSRSSSFNGSGDPNSSSACLRASSGGMPPMILSSVSLSIWKRSSESSGASFFL